MKRLHLLMIAGACCVAANSMAAIVEISDDFSTTNNTYVNWVSVGVSNAVIQHDAVSTYDFDKNDFVDSTGNPLDGDNIVSNLVGDTEALGDGLLMDGGLVLNTQDGTQGNEAMGLTLGGTMELDEKISLTATLYNDNNSFTSVRIQLYNLTDGVVLAESANTTIQSYPNVNYVPINFSLEHQAVTTDVGDTLQIRLVENANSGARDGYVDNFALTSFVIEPFPLADVSVEDMEGMSVETVTGIQYTLESSDNMGTSWTSTGMSVLGNGETMYLFDPKGFSASKIYRVTGSTP